MTYHLPPEYKSESTYNLYCILYPICIMRGLKLLIFIVTEIESRYMHVALQCCNKGAHNDDRNTCTRVEGASYNKSDGYTVE